MAYHLLDNPNPKASGGFHGHPSRNASVTAVTIHTAETSPTSSSAKAIGDYFARTATQVSYHTGVDSSEARPYLPYGYTAFHVRGFNSPSLGLSFCTRASVWGQNPSWDSSALQHGADELKKMSDTHSIPLRRISANQAKAGTKGIVSHAQMDPGRRSDPGAAFPWDEFLGLVRGVGTGPFPISKGESGSKVLEWQEMLLEWDEHALPEWGADGGYGDETAEWTTRWQRSEGRPESGEVGKTDWNALKEQLRQDEAEEEETVYDVAVVYLNELDEGMAWCLGPIFRWKVLPGDQINKIGSHALLVGSAQRLEGECQELGIQTRVYAGDGRRESGLEVARKIQEGERTP